MINLLPQNAAAEMKSLYRKRLIATSLIFLFLLIIISAVLMVPSIFAERQKLEVVETALSKALERPISKQADEISAVVKSTNIKIAIFNTKRTTPTFIQMTDRIFSHKIDGISILGIDLTSEGVIRIKGLANKRNVLLSFIKAFESDPYFSEVVSPISNLITTSDIDFNIDLKLTNSEVNKAKKDEKK